MKSIFVSIEKTITKMLGVNNVELDWYANSHPRSVAF
jgi:hypothetical protein